MAQLSGYRPLKKAGLFSADPTDDRAKIEWVMRAPQGSQVTITASGQRVGRIQTTIGLH